VAGRRGIFIDHQKASFEHIGQQQAGAKEAVRTESMVEVHLFCAGEMFVGLSGWASPACGK